MSSRFENTQVSATSHGGWLRGESWGGSLDRAFRDLNSDGYRVVILIPDRWSLWRQLINALRSICTFGFSTRSPGFIVIGERPAHE